MQAQPPRHADLPQTLFTGADAAPIRLSVPGWSNSLLVQLMRCPVGKPNAFSLHTLYRERSMTFEATVRFDVGDETSPLDAVLLRFVRCDGYEQAVLEPLDRQVRRHFNR